MANWLQTWFDNLCDVMAVTDIHGKQIHSFYIFKKNDYPDAITPEQIPCAVSYVSEPEVMYSEGGPNILFWRGQTEFHLTTDVKPANIPYILSFFEIIIRACAAKMKLNNTVEHFAILQKTPGAMQFATYKNARNEDDHQGVVIRWEVKQPVNADLTVSR